MFSSIKILSLSVFTGQYGWFFILLKKSIIFQAWLNFIPEYHVLFMVTGRSVTWSAKLSCL